MVHIAPLPPWRRRAQRIVGFLLSALGVVVLVIAIVALRQPNGRQASARGTAAAVGASSPAAVTTTPASTLGSTPPNSSSAAPKSSPTVTPSTSTDSVKSVPLIVLNSTSRSGLAESAAQQFRTSGWTVTSTGNLVNNILSTCAYYDPKVAGAEAAANALQAQFSGIKRVKPKFSGLPAGPIVVVLTTDWSTT